MAGVKTIEEIVDTAVANPGAEFDPSAAFGVDLRRTAAMVPFPEVQGMKLLGKEVDAIGRFWVNELTAHFQQRDVNLFAGKFPLFVAGALAAKKELGGVIGLNEGQIRPCLIRPVTVFAASGAETQNWLQSSVVAGWQAAVFSIDLTALKSGSIVLSPSQRVTMEVYGIFDTDSSPKMFEYQVLDASGSPQSVHSLPLSGMIGNISVYPFGQVRRLAMQDKMTVDINYAAAGTSTPGLIGVQWQKSEYATAEKAATQ